MTTASQVGQAFYEGRKLTGGTRGNIKSLKIGDHVYLIGYGWAIYGKHDLKTGKITYYSGWRGYSRTTSKHLSQTGIMHKHDIKSSDKPTLEDIKGEL